MPLQRAAPVLLTLLGLSKFQCSFFLQFDFCSAITDENRLDCSTSTSQILILKHQEPTAFENIVGKGENARNEPFLLFPQCFLLYQKSVSPFVHIFEIISLFAVELEESKIGISGKRLGGKRK